AGAAPAPAALRLGPADGGDARGRCSASLAAGLGLLPPGGIARCTDAEAALVARRARPPRRCIARSVEPVPRVPGSFRIAEDHIGTPVEETLGAVAFARAGHRLRDERPVAEPAIVAIVRERRRCRVRA